MGGGGSAAQPQLADPDRPRYHVHPPQGWMNDPNGPVFYKGRYHMFYQHLPNACEWSFGIVWGHAVSTDLVHWQHLPPALVPTPGTLDADGCFSGSCVLDSDGTPVLLYTGVRLRSNLDAGPLPPPEHDLGMVWVESQLAAVPEDPDDELLIRWRKLETPFLHLPPSHLQLTGWRDPFVFVTNTAAPPRGGDSGFEANRYSQDLRMLIGSGLKGRGGTALVYKSRSLFEGWELEGTLCEAPTTDTGVVWECPLLVPLDPLPRSLRPPTKHHPPRWLVLPGQAPVAADGGSRGGEGVGQEVDGAGKRGALATVLAADRQQRHYHSPPRDQAVGAPDASRSSQAAATEAAADCPGLVTAAAEAAAAATAAVKELEAAIAHQRTGSFAFDQEPSVESLDLAEGAASALHAWQLQAAGSGSPQPSPKQPQPQLGPAAGGSSTASSTLQAAAVGAVRGALEAAKAVRAKGQAEAPSDVAALPPGRRRRPVPDARLDLESALTLEEWSRSNSAAPSPLQPNSSAGSPDCPASPTSGGQTRHTRQQAPQQQEQQQQREGPSRQLQDGSPLQEQQEGAAAGKDAAAEQGPVAKRADSPGGASVASSASLAAPVAPDQQEQEQQQQQPAPRHPFDQQLEQGPGQGQGAALDGQPPQEERREARGECEDEDRFAAAFSRVRSIRARTRSKDRSLAELKFSPARRASLDAAAAAVAAGDAERRSPGPAAKPGGLGAQAEQEGTPPAPRRQWHFFTVSPDAPTNPVLYWVGHVQDTDVARFELETAKGPYRLDLGDILYAPNVCQDDKGRWLLWGWLQERRKVGSYNYAGCLTLPRVLHCTDDGRLIQAPIPELEQLRQGPAWRQQDVTVPAEATVPLKAPAGACALDIELTLDRGSAYAAGLLFQSYEAEAEGSTALVYDWERNTLEAIFNVPPNWQPQVAAEVASTIGGYEEHLDPALLLTPRPGGMAGLQGLSRNPSVIFSPEGFDSATATPRTTTASLAEESSSAVLSPQRTGITIAGAPRMPALDLGIPGLPLPPFPAPPELPLGGGALGGGGGAQLSAPLPRSTSAFPPGFLGGGAGGGFSTAAAAGGGLAVGSLPAAVGGGGLYRSVSDARASALGGVPRIRSHGALSQLGGSQAGRGGLLTPRRSPQAPQPLGADTDADLDFLLEELSAPMREAPPPIVEPRRVGGPLPQMHPGDPLHLRILVDHSCIEVYTGTGETLSTRIYRGQTPETCADAGISLIAFGGPAVVKRSVTYEMGSAWHHPGVGDSALAAATKAASAAGSPKPASPAVGVVAAASPAAAAAAAVAVQQPFGEAPAVGAEPADSAGTAAAASAAADALLDDLVMCVSPQCSATMVPAFS